jgi:hypothetical protein
MRIFNMLEMIMDGASLEAFTVIQACVGLLASFASGAFSFAVDCNDTICPASAYNLVTAAWANIGYMTHADFLYLINKTNFSAWAPLLYIIGAIGGLIGVAINTPPRNYVWFFLGPCIFNFLEFTTTNVKGVSWKVAGVQQDMKLVWRDAESGLANTQLAKREGIQISKDDGPQGTYEVAWMLVFLDRLFSASTDGMVKFIGIGSQRAGAGQNTNLAGDDGSAPWFRMATAKWGMLENVVGVSARDPNVRDALVTFLGSECGDHFKKGVDTGKYIASQSNRGMSVAPNVLKIEGSSGQGYDGSGELQEFTYQPFVQAMDSEVIPTPRSIIRLFNQQSDSGNGGGVDTRGNFTNFSARFANEDKFNSGRTTEIVCSEVLYTVIEALRWESGHAYWQLLRSAPGVCEDQNNPSCFTKEQVLRTLFYGWDIRANKTGPYASDTQLEDFTKYLIFLYMLRNELMFAPQITESGQRFSPAEQTKNFSESYVRQQGSRSKAAELYNWAVMMPHVQGILTYLVMIFYPFAAMFMVIPGYWKAFFTWISFLAWVKLWDVGFAIVHTLERSVWAMLGNHSSMARVANGLIQTGQDNPIMVECGGASPAKCAIPNVTSGMGLDMEQAWRLLDRTLLLMGTADLDLANGYYIYIMSALYFAVPAVAGQLVLGAKAGMASMAVQGISQVAGEAGNAAKSASVGESVNKLQTNQGSLTQAAVGKSHRQGGLALQQLENSNAALDAGLNQARLGATKNALGQASEAARMRGASFSGNANFLKAVAGNVGDIADGIDSRSRGGGSGGGSKGPLGQFAKVGTGLYNTGLTAAENGINQQQYGANARSAMFNAGAEWASQRSGQRAQGLQDYGRKLGAEADFAAQTAAWEAKNDMATHLAGLGGVAGMNPGALSPGNKPMDATGMLMSGQLGNQARATAQYSGFGFMSAVDDTTRRGNAMFGSSFVNGHWGGGYTIGQTAALGSKESKNVESYIDGVRKASTNEAKKVETIYFGSKS